jgi:lipid A 3-O-deacylase
MFFQNMQSPTDIELTELQSDYVPYAGLVVFQTTLYAWDRYQSDQLSLYVGAVGPVTLAAQSQKSIWSRIGQACQCACTV